MEIPHGILDRVFSHIDGDELAQLALDLGKIRGPSGYEEEAGEFVFQWMKANDLNPTKQFVSEERFNVMGFLPGSGTGKSLAFNSHLDTAPAFVGEDQTGLEDTGVYRSWAERDRLYGIGVMNCRGPMSVWLVAGKALQKSGVRLGGDVVLAAVVGEIGLAPVEEYQGTRYFCKGFGTEHAVRYGPAVDYAIVAETTDFALAWAECGILYLRVTVKGKRVYSPRLKEYKTLQEHPNAILKMMKVIEAVEGWAREYEARKIYEFPGGVIKPKVNIGAIRGGFPPGPSMTPSQCSIYLNIRLLPGEGPAEILKTIREAISRTGMEAQVSTYLFKRGYIGRNVDPLLKAIEESYFSLFGEKTPQASSEVTSMWRDLNIYNEAGIPAITFGPKRYTDEVITPEYGIKYLLKEDLVKVAKIYAMAALKICSYVP